AITSHHSVPTRRSSDLTRTLGTHPGRTGLATGNSKTQLCSSGSTPDVLWRRHSIASATRVAIFCMDQAPTTLTLPCTDSSRYPRSEEHTSELQSRGQLV